METAEEISRSLISQHMAACVNLLPGIISIYEWDGKIERSQEVLLLIKSTEQRQETIRKLVLEKHPYELPELVTVTVTAGHEDYLNWIEQCTK